MLDHQAAALTTALQAALLTPDTDVTTPIDPASLTSRIGELHLCGSLGTVARVTVPIGVRELPEFVVDQRASMRSNVYSAIRRASDRTGHVYSQEVTHVLMPSGKLFILAVITREE
jgi:hypothetical protein